MFYWSNNGVVAVLPIITLLALVASLCMAHGMRWMGQDLDLAEEQDLH